jgi:ornithine decarboxylase
MEFTPVLVRATASEPSPMLLVDLSLVRRAYEDVAASLPTASVFYSMKANPHPAVLQTLVIAGCGLEVSSIPELKLALATGIEPRRIISSNPVKRPEFIRYAAEAGVDCFAFDSITELKKLAQWAPGSRVYVRLAVNNEGSDWPLLDKYGVGGPEASDLLLESRQLGLIPFGVTFHVGSQCRNADAWHPAIAASGRVFATLNEHGIKLSMLNLGGGQPIPQHAPVPTLGEIGRRIRAALDNVFEGNPPMLSVEPGRALVGTAGTLVTSVIGRAERGDATWVYIDAGVFNALTETIEGLRYELRTERGGPLREVTLAGPSCDSVDVPFKSELMPELSVGDRIYIMNAAAYTLSYASHFNGFEPPLVKVVDSLEEPCAEALAGGIEC